MVLTLIFLTILFVYSQFKIKKLNKRIDDISNSINSQLDKNKLYLLDEIDNKSSSNLDFLYKEIENIKKAKQDEFKVYVGDLIKARYIENKNLLIRKFDRISKNIT